MVLGRWSGSVGVEISREELNALLDEIKVARAGTTDRGLIGLSLVAESFLPLGELTGGQTMPTEAELEATRRPAEAAAAIAREIDDPDLLSAALDAQAASFLGQRPDRGPGLDRRAPRDRGPAAADRAGGPPQHARVEPRCPGRPRGRPARRGVCPPRPRAESGPGVGTERCELARVVSGDARANGTRSRGRQRVRFAAGRTPAASRAGSRCTASWRPPTSVGRVATIASRLGPRP